MADYKQEARELAKRIRLRKESLKSVERGIIISLERAVNKVINEVDFNNASVVDSLAVLNSLENAMVEAGLGELFGEIEDVYGEELIFIEKSLLRSGLPAYTDLDRETLRVIVDADLDGLFTNFDEFAGDIKQALTRNILAGEAPNIDLTNLSSRVARNVTTEFDTALSGIDRSITLKKAREAFGDNVKFIYLGALDGKTRPFCLKHIGKTYTLKEIRELDNGQGLDPFIYGGGYNCRHVWRVTTDGNKD